MKSLRLEGRGTALGGSEGPGAVSVSILYRVCSLILLLGDSAYRYSPA